MNSSYLENAKSELCQKYNLLNWLLGNFFVSLGICFATKSNFGLSMIAAPPYIIHVWLRDIYPWFTQGTAEYVFEAIVLIITCILIRQFKFRYLLSFGEALVSGFFIDGWLLIFGGNGPYDAMSMRIIGLICGLFFIGLGVAFFFRTTLPLQTYELSVVEISKTYKLEQHKVKQIFDIILLAVSFLLSFLLTGRLTGIGISTVLSTLFNSSIIKYTGKAIDKLESKSSPES